MSVDVDYRPSLQDDLSYGFRQIFSGPQLDTMRMVMGVLTDAKTGLAQRVELRDMTIGNGLEEAGLLATERDNDLVMRLFEGVQTALDAVPRGGQAAIEGEWAVRNQLINMADAIRQAEQGLI